MTNISTNMDCLPLGSHDKAILFANGHPTKIRQGNICLPAPPSASHRRQEVTERPTLREIGLAAFEAIDKQTCRELHLDSVDLGTFEDIVSGNHHHMQDTLVISAIVDPSLLVSKRVATVPGPSWENLERLDVTFQLPKTPEGSMPNLDHVVPLVEAFGLACQQMPSLQYASLTTTVSMPLETSQGTRSSLSPWGVYFATPGVLFSQSLQRDPDFRGNVRLRRLLWDVKDWRPDRKLRDIFRVIGREQHGGGLIEKFVDFWAVVEKPNQSVKRRRVHS